VVVGGGAVAARKVRGLVEAGADVTLVSPTLHADLQATTEASRLRWIQREACDDDLIDANLVFLATSDTATNERLEKAARAHGALVNRADSPDDGTFHVPAALRRGDITVAVSTGGRAPGIAQVVRDHIESGLTDAHVTLLDLIGEARQAVHEAGISTDSDAWRDLMADNVLQGYLEAGQRDLALQYVVSHMSSDSLARVAR
jgi:siroheme synthase-like protein